MFHKIITFLKRFIKNFLLLYFKIPVVIFFGIVSVFWLVGFPLWCLLCPFFDLSPKDYFEPILWLADKVMDILIFEI